LLDLGERPVHPHNLARRTLLDLNGVFQPAPAPRYSETKLERPDPPRREGQDGETILAELGSGTAEIEAILKAGGCIRSTSKWKPACSSACRSPPRSMARSTLGR